GLGVRVRGADVVCRGSVSRNAGDRVRLVGAECGDLLVGSLAVEIGGHDPSAVLHESAAQGRTDPSAGTGDDGDAVVDLHAFLPPVAIARSSSRSMARLRIFPVPPLGSASTNANRCGTL